MNWTIPNEPVDEETLKQALEIVDETAYQNGVDVERDWPCRPDDDPDRDINIVRLVLGGRSNDS